jgi:hypothetical protein
MTPASAADIDQVAAALSAAIAAKIGPKGPGLARQLRRAGRRLPRRVRRAVRHVVEAQALHGHPKLLRMVDGPALMAARDEVLAYLDRINPTERRRTAAVRLAAVIALNLLVIGAVVIGVLVWRGYL